MKKSYLLAALVTSVVAGFWGATGYAQSGAYPSKPIRVVVPFAAGGNTDAVARLISAKMAEQMGQPVVVENRAGANSVIGAEFVAKSPPDGYTLLIVTPAHVINPLVNLKLPYDTLRDFVPVSLVGRLPYVLGVSNLVPAANLKELIAYAKANPDKLSFASSGAGSGAHLTTELFKMTAGIQMLHVPYKGTAAAIPDLVSGRVSLIFDVEQVLMPLIKGGKLRGFAITSASRSRTAPDVPTMEEGGLPGLVTTTWIGMLGPRDLPSDIANRVSAEVKRAMNAPEVRDKLIEFGFETVASTPDELSAYIRSEMARWVAVAKHIKLKPE